MRSCVIPGLSKPAECAECPICNEYDECLLLPKWYRTWDEQYRECPLVEVQVFERRPRQ